MECVGSAGIDSRYLPIAAAMCSRYYAVQRSLSTVRLFWGVALKEQGPKGRGPGKAIDTGVRVRHNPRAPFERELSLRVGEGLARRPHGNRRSPATRPRPGAKSSTDPEESWIGRNERSAGRSLGPLLIIAWEGDFLSSFRALPAASSIWTRTVRL